MSLGTTTISGQENVGFLARLMDYQDWDSFQYWALAVDNPLDVNTRKRPPTVVSDLESLAFPRLWWEQDQDVELAREVEELLVQVQTPKSRTRVASESSLDVSQRESLITLQRTLAKVRSDIASQSVGKNASGDYTGFGIGSSLRDTARILKAKSIGAVPDLSGKDALFLVSQSGYDTHSDQNSAQPDAGLPGLLSILAGNLSVFYRDLQSIGLLEQTTVIVYSEFGRTLFENGASGAASVGTDHGHASSTFVMSGAIRAKAIGEAPGTAELLDDDYNALVPKIDFRDIFGDALAWMGIDPLAIFDDPTFRRRPLGIFD